jgi:hypothetical protein
VQVCWAVQGEEAPGRGFSRSVVVEGALNKLSGYFVKENRGSLGSIGGAHVT